MNMRGMTCKKLILYLFPLVIIFFGIFWAIKIAKGSQDYPETKAKVVEINNFIPESFVKKPIEFQKNTERLFLQKEEVAVFESEVFKADFDFNAIASIWESGGEVKIELNLSKPI